MVCLQATKQINSQKQKMEHVQEEQSLPKYFLEHFAISRVWIQRAQRKKYVVKRKKDQIVALYCLPIKCTAGGLRTIT
jgi:6-phosphogluconolactonase (cycloisomerase 2 family)